MKANEELLEAVKRLMTVICMGETKDNTMKIALDFAEQAIKRFEHEKDKPVRVIPVRARRVKGA